MQHKLAAQGRRYQAELALVGASKDAHFEAMLTAKDAQLLSLVEGTDIQGAKAPSAPALPCSTSTCTHTPLHVPSL